MPIRITTLSENTANYGVIAEWGLSILVEVDETSILMDTGLSFSAVHNAARMGVDLTTIDSIVLSHGHADHTGGLKEVLEIKGAVDVIAHPDIWVEKYAKRGQGEERKIGIPFPRQELEELGARFTLTREPFNITSHVMTTGEVPMVTEYEKIEKGLFVKEGEELVPDPLAEYNR